MLYHKIENPHRYNKKQDVSSIAYMDCGYLETPKGFCYKKRFLDQFELIYVMKGSVHLRLSNRFVTLNKNSLIMLPPYKTVEGFQESTQPTAFYYVNFVTDSPQDFSILPGKEQVDTSSRIAELFGQLHKLKSEAASPEYVMDAVVLLLLHEIAAGRENLSHSAEIAAQFRSYVEQNLSKPLTAEMAAQALTYHKDYLGKIVKKHFGVSLKDYINRQKLDLAKKLLTASNYSVREISQMTGFAEPNLFTKFFKYHTKQSPADYRFTHAL